MRRSTTPKFQLQYDPAIIPELTTEFLRQKAKTDQAMEDAGRRIVNGTFTRRDADIIYEWKSARRMDLFRKNSDAEIALALQDAVNAKSVRKAIAALTRLRGVGVKMASAFLTAMFPHKYTVLDFRSLDATTGAENGDGVRLYLHYLRACRNMARRYGATLRDFDRANWQWSKNKSNKIQPCRELSCRRSDVRAGGRVRAA